MSLTPTLPKNILELVLNEGHGAKDIAEMCPNIVPKEYIKPKNERFDTYKVAHNVSIPIIDVSNLDDPKVENQICNAAEKWGFFQIINHGIPLKELEDVKKAAHRFFELPSEVKRKYLMKNSPTSNVKYATSFMPQFEKVLDWKDYLTLLYVSEEEALAYWPVDCRDEALRYLKNTEIVTRRLIKTLMKGLQINEIDENKEALLMGSKRINLTFYPKCSNPDLVFGNSKHSDASIITILLQDDVGGLYVRHFDNENWVHVPSIEGALVINIGDTLEILSNGKYKSVEHSVVVNKNKNRVSVPIFVHPKLDVIIAPFQELIDRGEKPLYKRVLFSDYIKNFHSMPHDGKAPPLEFATLSD